MQTEQPFPSNCLEFTKLKFTIQFEEYLEYETDSFSLISFTFSNRSIYKKAINSICYYTYEVRAAACTPISAHSAAFEAHCVLDPFSTEKGQSCSTCSMVGINRSVMTGMCNQSKDYPLKSLIQCSSIDKIDSSFLRSL